MAAAARNLSALNSDDPVQAVRRFNRFYTRQIGVLQEHLLHSQFSLTEVRVLYELAHRDGVTAVELCRELGLDRGYLSRMLHNFQKQGWIKTTPSPADRRRIFLSLTSKGRKVFAPLDHRSSEEVSAMLKRLSSSQREKLLVAMHAIEGILNGGAGEAPVSPNHASRDAIRPEPQGLKPTKRLPSSGTTGSRALPGRALLDQLHSSAEAPKTAYILRQHRPGDMGWVVQRHGELYWQEYRYDERFEALVAQIVAEFVQNFDCERERCWIAEKDGERVGAIFLVKKSKTVAKLRLLLVEPSARGLGIGKRLVAECVNFARAAGYKKVLLWTQNELHAARHLYEHAGFKRIAQKPHQSWGQTDSVAETWALKL
jgi:DNA-binding MarR family transcriptional regulator/GNAT superfamily N-acetyltransferase